VERKLKPDFRHEKLSGWGDLVLFSATGAEAKYQDKKQSLKR